MSEILSVIFVLVVKGKRFLVVKEKILFVLDFKGSFVLFVLV